MKEVTPLETSGTVPEGTRVPSENQPPIQILEHAGNLIVRGWILMEDEE